MDQSTITSRLAEAETALHQLAIGGRPVRIQAPDGSSVEFATGDMVKLQQYVTFLKGQVSSTIRRPIQFEFGR